MFSETVIHFAVGLSDKDCVFASTRKMRSLNKIISHHSRLLLLLLFISYSGSVMMFYHTHLVKGTLITHSHPYKVPEKNGPVESHSHSSSQYLLLQHLCNTSMTDSLIEFVVVPDMIFDFFNVIESPYSDPFSANVTLTESLRGPPVC